MLDLLLDEEQPNVCHLKIDPVGDDPSDDEIQNLVYAAFELGTVFACWTMNNLLKNLPIAFDDSTREGRKFFRPLSPKTEESLLLMEKEFAAYAHERGAGILFGPLDVGVEFEGEDPQEAEEYNREEREDDYGFGTETE